MKPGDSASNAPGAERCPRHRVPEAPQQPADGGQAVLQRDLGHFLVDLSIALHKFAMYPARHPSLAPALETLARRADALLQDRARFAVGVARDRLVIEGVVTDEHHPLLRSLAERLHRHHLSALSFCRGVSIEELRDVLQAVAEDPERGGTCLGALGGANPWPHVRLHPLVAQGLEIVSEQAAEGGTVRRAAELWIGLAQAALGGASDDTSREQEAEPATVARAIDDHQRVEAYDQVIVGYMLQIAEEVRDARDPDTLELRHRVSTLVSSIRPETLSKLLVMGGQARQRQQFLRSAAAGMRAGAVVSLVKAAAEARGGAVSTGLMRVLTKLAAHAEAGPASVQPLADSALREQVERLSAEWSLEDPNPADYTESLERIAQETRNTREQDEAPGRLDALAEPLRLLEICLEVEEGGAALARAVDAAANAGWARDAIVLLAPLRREGPAREAWERLVSAGTVARLLACSPPDLASIDVLLPHLHGPALAPLFDALVGSDDRHVRRAVYDRLRCTGLDGATQALARLADDRWYVTRNLLALLAEMQVLPPEADPSPWLAHGDPRVRREALRVALRSSALRQRATWTGLGDADERVLRVAVSGALAHPHAAYRPRLLDLTAREALDDELRANAIEALARVAPGVDVLDVLLQIASSHARLIGRGGPPSKSTAAALKALAALWPNEPRVLAVLRHATLPLNVQPAVAGQRVGP